MTETKIEIERKYKKPTINPRKQLKPGEFMIVTKGDFAEAAVTSDYHAADGYPGKVWDAPGKFGPQGSAEVLYNGESVMWYLKGKPGNDEVAAFNAAGGVGDQVKITCEERRFDNEKTGATMLYKGLIIERAE